MRKYGNNAQAGFGMIVVAASLAAVGLIGLMIGEDVLFSDDMQRANTAHFNECKENDFKLDGCEKYWDRINTEISGIFVDLDK
ncbi:hypothetical protein HX858_05140 [Marine Group I thaumarchaeote]|uniref:Uncharacterized protein n=1 Tax=Marine Group I thaumarchaeote TaxID=2511932 RepID=A0A7K4P154_9ARCH|nr:hypothetical protein [Marine Group I thaumarchaeote]NWJ57122.1 hypothetical protein [Marine Group I thaumarchaeote]NWJ84234.1 hypothetical protein [Marine Group I thaumarchaeote]NWK09022.1 hypothetical protein [Marine Group I thaumarchaeote]